MAKKRKATRRRRRASVGRLTTKSAMNLVTDKVLPGAVGFAAGSYVPSLPVVKNYPQYASIASLVLGTAIAVTQKGFVSNMGVGVAIRGGADFIGQYLPSMNGINLLAPGSRGPSHAFPTRVKAEAVKAL